MHRNRVTLAVDIARERELDEKREQKRARAAAKLAQAQGMMSVDEPPSEPAVQPASATTSRKTKLFGKVKVKAGKKIKVKHPGAAPVRASLQLKRHGIRKPSAIMRKTLKKMAKRREMEMG